MENNETLHIVASDLLDYSFKVEQAVKDGWTFSDLNIYCPRAWPHMFEAWMIKQEVFKFADGGVLGAYTVANDKEGVITLPEKTTAQTVTVVNTVTSTDIPSDEIAELVAKEVKRSGRPAKK